MKILSLTLALLIATSYTTAVFAEDDVDRTLENDLDSDIELVGITATAYGSTVLLKNVDRKFKADILSKEADLGKLLTERDDQFSEAKRIQNELNSFIQQNPEVKKLADQIHSVESNYNDLLAKKQKVDLDIDMLRVQFASEKDISLYKTHHGDFKNELERTPEFLRAKAQQTELIAQLKTAYSAKKALDDSQGLKGKLTKAKLASEANWVLLNPHAKADQSIAHKLGNVTHDQAMQINNNLKNKIYGRRWIRLFYGANILLDVELTAQSAYKLLSPNVIDSSNWSKKIESKDSHQQMINEASLADMAK